MSELQLPRTTAQLSECDGLQSALSDFHKRIGSGRGREAACRHLNRGFEECFVSVACQDEWEAEAQLSLSVCLSSHQHRLSSNVDQYNNI
ncbi:hypothetical protein D8674_002678 [Pyrus ussuriensis x Pyrus communis]|uniref:COX assembly mitochondrial protein n=1 Tax=Pyrus ussuriensis x Pyrus communis TaxID=2448454 RepID=A0A5N5FFQ1_9ROSA|nr:hypothetical protein D8674_002678 [Pyrus ussuriensis x Pyrus communis]